MKRRRSTAQDLSPKSVVAPTILLEHEGLIACAKPAGLPSSGRAMNDPSCLQFQLMKHFGRTIWAIHQLDQDTSGLNLFVNKKSLVQVWQRRLGRATKRYLAICHGFPDFERRVVEAPIAGRRSREGWLWCVDPDGKPAKTTIYVRQRAADVALLEVDIATGRTHQIRIHLAHIGHPLVGERRYREPPCGLHTGHALHASSLRFAKGIEPNRLGAPVPDDLIALGDRLGLSLSG